LNVINPDHLIEPVKDSFDRVVDVGLVRICSRRPFWPFTDEVENDIQRTRFWGAQTCLQHGEPRFCADRPLVPNCFVRRVMTALPCTGAFFALRLHERFKCDDPLPRHLEYLRSVDRHSVRERKLRTLTMINLDEAGFDNAARFLAFLTGLRAASLANVRERIECIAQPGGLEL
jgi:hypothetical protein